MRDCTNSCSCPDTDLPSGSDGLDGQYGGYSSKWKFDTGTAVNPSSSFLRLNNTTLSSVTNIYINDTNADSGNLDAFLDYIDNSARFGYIRIFKEFDSSTFFYGDVTAVTDNGTYHTIAITFIASNGAFAANDNVVFTFSPRGPIGLTGSNAPFAIAINTASGQPQTFSLIQDYVVTGLPFTTLAAGTYTFFYEGTAFSDVAAATGYYSVFNAGVEVAASRRLYGNAGGVGIADSYYKCATNVQIILGAPATIDVRFHPIAATATIHTAGTFTYIKSA